MKFNFRIDYLLLIPACILILISLTTLASINPTFFRNQLISLAIAVVLFLMISQVDYRAFKTIKKPLYIASLVLLSIVLLLGIESRGAVRWIELFGIRIQLSEILKPILSLVFASYIAGIKQFNLKTFFITMAYVFPIILLIDLQPDLGNALIYAGVFIITLIVIGVPFRWFALAALPVIVLSPFLWARLHDYQKQRVITFLQPQADPLGTSYNSIQALIAVGSGMFSGKGLGESTQSSLRFLPERHTDFIFATLSEGMGFIGGLIVIIAFFFLLYRLYTIFQNTNDLYEKTFLVCGFSFFLIQFFVNIGMNLGFVPVVGVTLPFISFGGSSLVSCFIFLAIASAISISSKKHNVLEIR